MSVTRLFFAVCETCGCPAGTDEDMQDTAAAARRAARHLGWTVRGLSTWCPAHTPTTAAPVPGVAARAKEKGND